MKATATYSVKKWQEEPVELLGHDKKISKATVEYEFQGDLVGIARVEYLMFYKHFDLKDRHNSISDYVGLMHFNGTLNGKKGSFILEDMGKYENGLVNSTLKIVDVSGTDELMPIHGHGRYHATISERHFDLNYELR